MGYWDATDLALSENGGIGPPCPACGREMFPIDDHGRFQCFCGYSDGNILGSIFGRSGGFLKAPKATDKEHQKPAQ